MQDFNRLTISSLLQKNKVENEYILRFAVPLESDNSALLGVGGDGGFERTLSGDIRCSSPDELVPSDWVSEP